MGYAAQEVTKLPDAKLKAAQSKGTLPIEENQISRKEIKTSPVVTVTDFLSQQQSMVRLNQTADSSQTAVSIRGFGDNAAANSLILIDGFPLTSVSLLPPNLNSIALDDIERMDIIQGSRGVLWGDQAVGGVVNIITRHPRHRVIDAGGALGNYRYRTGYVLVGNQFDNGLGFKMIGSRLGTDQYRQHNRFTNGLFSVTGYYDYANGSLMLRANVTDQSIALPGGLSKKQYHERPWQATNFLNETATHAQLFQLLHQHAWSDRWTLETRILHQELRGNGFVFSDFNRNEWENRISPRLRGKINQHELTMGGEWLNSNYGFSNRSADESAKQNQQHIFIHDKIALSETLWMTIGVRSVAENSVAEKIKQQPLSLHHHVVVSEQGLIYRANQNWQFYLRRDGNFRFPKATELTGIPADNGAIFPQTGVSYETGLVYQNQKHKFGMNLYDLLLHHELGFDPTPLPNRPFGSYRNFDPTERLGASLWDTWFATESTTIDGQFNYVNAHFVRGRYKNNDVPLVPNVTSNIGIMHQFMPHWRGRYSVVYTGPRFPSGDFMNQGRLLSGYYLHYVSLQYVTKVTQISFEIGNVFNQRYPSYVIFDGRTEKNTYYPGNGRTYLLTVKTTFD